MKDFHGINRMLRNFGKIGVVLTKDKDVAVLDPDIDYTKPSLSAEDRFASVVEALQVGVRNPDKSLSTYITSVDWL